MIVMKFGGTSLADRERLERMASLVVVARRPVAVVVSAMGGTTDRLLRAGRAAAAGDEATARDEIAHVEQAHLEACDGPELRRLVSDRADELRSLLHGVALLQEQTPRSRALLASFGERLSAPIAAAAIRAAGREAEWVDAREFVRTDGRYEAARVDAEATRRLGRERLLPVLEARKVPVITGFLGSTSDGVTTVLGRSGSDYTAALVGAVLDVEEVVIWTDVDGILTADPRVVPEARTLERVSYREAAEMSYFGARVLHPKTMLPCEQASIPIRIRSTFAPEQPGTVVGALSSSVPHGVKTVSTIDDQALVTVAGRGMAGLPGIARRIFEAAERRGVNVLMISQASSEQTVSVVVDGGDGPVLQQELREALALELEAGLVGSISCSSEVSVLSVIGEGMAGHPGIAGDLFGALGAVGVNVLAIAQGGSELSISVAIGSSHAHRAVRAVHTAFGLTRTVHLVLIGRGRVGRELLGMLDDLHARDADVTFRLVAVAGSRQWVFDPHGIELSEAASRVDDGPARPDDEQLVDRVAAERLTDVVLVDVSAAPLQPLHKLALQAGFNVVTANKVPLSGSLASYRELVAARDAARVRYGYETTFGAGLPVLHTLKELVATGDELRRVEGCFSGTLGFLCTRLEQGLSLAEAVEEARSLGYTEPDPREDLSGRDVARKALIVARALGFALEPDDVETQPFVPGLDRGLSEALAAFEEPFRARLEAARSEGHTLRYVARVAEGSASVGLESVPRSGPIGSLEGPDNILVFTTRRYDRYPLVVRGPGAGAEVTAAGVLGDLLRIT